MAERNDEQTIQVTVSARHITEPAAARAYALEKFGRIGKFSPSLRTVDVMLQPEGMMFSCEARLIQDRQARIAVSMMAGDLHSAIDLAVDRAQGLLTREKERASDSVRRGVRRPSDDG